MRAFASSLGLAFAVAGLVIVLFVMAIGITFDDQLDRKLAAVVLAALCALAIGIVILSVAGMPPWLSSG